MPRRTLILIIGLVLITIFLFALALKNNNAPLPVPTPVPSEQVQTAPTVPADTILTLLPNPVSLATGEKGNVAVNINTSDNDVTTIQLEIAYDPNYITNVQVAPAGIIQNPVLIINRNNVKEGRYTYAFGIMPNQPAVKGFGTIATISFTAVKEGSTQLALLPTTIVTAKSVTKSVLKSASGTLINIVPPRNRASPILGTNAIPMVD